MNQPVGRISNRTPRRPNLCGAVTAWLLLCLWCTIPSVYGATVQPRYYAHPAVHDRYGVIAPWYRGLNG
ncbi:MAG: hypothetical protein QHJ82_08360 [Verrucomicrobiota bacterium]|nr:hypothetical protein [Verrucomicrobiota bacterium]